MSQRTFGLVTWLTMLLLLLPSCTVALKSGDDAPKVGKEREYEQVWSAGWALVNQINLNPCNSGGSIQECFEVTSMAISEIEKFSNELAAVEIPDSYTVANGEIRKALQQLAEGYSIRNGGISASSDSEFIRGNETVVEANLLIRQAYEKFPDDSRPRPRPL